MRSWVTRSSRFLFAETIAIDRSWHRISRDWSFSEVDESSSCKASNSERRFKRYFSMFSRWVADILPLVGLF